MTTLLRRCWFRRVHFQVVGEAMTLCKRTPPPLETQRYEPPWGQRRPCTRCFDRLDVLRSQGARVVDTDSPLFNHAS